MKSNKIKINLMPRKNLEDFCKTNDIFYMAVFGSFARGDNKVGSDIDLLVKFSKNKSLIDLGGIKVSLEEKLDREVDLIPEGSLHPRIRPYVLDDLVTIYE